eukprot:m.193374 g.193374  ORF g.193374 m.193374 type:complete len:481 (-) comp18907_c0_seq1:27-1469(-)
MQYSTTTTLVMGAAAALLCSPHTDALDNGLGLTPPLAYSTWNYFNTDINSTLVIQLADALVSTGLRDAGFTTLNLDAGWKAAERDPSTGALIPNATKFPEGMAWLSHQLQQRNLSLGLYTDISNLTCGNQGVGSWGHYQQDAQTLAEWGVRYVKVDFCGANTHNLPPDPQLTLWRALRDALNATGVPIYYSICPHGHLPTTGTAADWSHNGTSYGYSPPLSWTVQDRHTLANSILVEYTNLFDFWYAPHWDDFRVCGPTAHCPTCPLTPQCHKSTPGGLLTNIDAMVALTQPDDSGPGTWADADMLHVCNFGQGGGDAGGRGDGGMTLDEYRASYSIWAVLASPIIISADLRTLATDHPDCLAMLLNNDVLAISQDPLGRPGWLVKQTTNATDPSPTAARTTNIVTQVFARVLEHGARAVVLFNRAETTMDMHVTWSDVGLPDNGRFTVHNVWTGESAPNVASGYRGTVPPHSVLMVRVG